MKSTSWIWYPYLIEKLIQRLMNMKKALIRKIKYSVLSVCDMIGIFSLSRNIFKKFPAIIMYHGFCGTTQRYNQISAAAFREHLKYLKKNFNVVSLQDLVNSLKDGGSVDNMVALTIDDGYQNFYLYAFPLLKQEKVSATVFLATDFIDQQSWHWPDQIFYFFTQKEPGEVRVSFPENKEIVIPEEFNKREDLAGEFIYALKGLPLKKRSEIIGKISCELGMELSSVPPEHIQPLTWDQVREMGTSGIDFGPHTCSHPSLGKLNVKDAKLEVLQSRNRIQEETGKDFPIFCYPFGKYDDVNLEVMIELQKQGFLAAVTGEYGFVDPMSLQLMELPRMSAQEDFLRFKNDINKFEFSKNIFRDSVNA